MSHKRSQRGIALAWTVLILFVMVLMVGLSIDMGIIALAANQLQNAADAAALAGAQWVNQSTSDAIQRAYDTAKANYVINNDVDLAYAYDAGGGYTNDMDIILGRYYGFRRRAGRPFAEYFVADMVQPNAVMATPRRTAGAPDGPVNYIFGPMAGVNSGEVWRHAIALCKDDSGAGILVLTPTGPGIRFGGTEAVHCPGGTIHVNSESENAVVYDGTIREDSIDARQLNITADAIDKTLVDDCPIPYELNQDPLPDPLANARRPGTTGGTPGPEVYDNPIYSGTGATAQERRDPISENNWPTDLTTGKKILQPGYYPAGFKISGSDWVLQPGVYIVGGGANGQSGLIFEGGTMNAEYCQFYVTKSTAEMGSVDGQLQITGGSFNISPPGDNPANYVNGKPVVDGALGVSIWQDDANTRQAKITGSAADSTVISGTIYFPRNEVAIAGTNIQIGNQLIAWQVDAGGTGEVWINYDGRNRGQPKLRSMIVE